MIVSHKHKYLFIEIDLTASWAIHNELIQNYDGKPILHKHATYHDFRRHASTEELKYFVFATVRNPLDKIVSRYFKLKNNHKEVFSSSNSLSRGIVDYSDLKKYQYVRKAGDRFENFFKTFYRRPYSDMIDLSSRDLDFVIRYESLQADFSKLLKELDLVQIQPLPQRNQTIGKPRNFLEYYTPEIIPQAKRICRPFMQRWGYQFPESWGDEKYSMAESLEYQILNRMRFFYFVYLRYSNSPYAKILRRIRATWFQ